MKLKYNSFLAETSLKLKQNLKSFWVYINTLSFLIFWFYWLLIRPALRKRTSLVYPAKDATWYWGTNCRSRFETEAPLRAFWDPQSKGERGLGTVTAI